METQYHYYAFISYKREDEKYAKWLQRKLESYRLPSVLCKKNPELPKRVKPVFLDQTDIQPRPLHDELKIKIEQSRFLIVICSPRSAKSLWVGEEIDYFVYLGRKDNIIAYIVDGEPYSRNQEAECYHEVIRRNFPASDNPKEDRQLLGVNLNEAGKGSKMMKREKAFAKVLSRMLDVSFDELWKRQHRRIIRNVLIYIALIMIFIGSVGFVWKVNQPFDVKVSLKEVTEHNDNLPFENGKIGLIYDTDTLYSKTIDEYDEVAIFKDIPARYFKEDAHLLFSMYGYDDVDTILLLEKVMQLRISRNDTWAKVHGFVRDEKTDELLENVQVAVLQQNTLTNKDGYFVLYFPIREQRTVYPAAISKNGETIFIEKVYPTQNEDKVLNTLYWK